MNALHKCSGNYLLTTICVTLLFFFFHFLIVILFSQMGWKWACGNLGDGELDLLPQHPPYIFNRQETTEIKDQPLRNIKYI